MRLDFNEVAEWPKLTWLAKLESCTGPVSVLHGPCVEINPSWCVEGVWSGSFEEGDFDLAEVVVGTGFRVRERQVVFVSSSDTLNRLLYCKDEGVLYVSNSLPALLAVTGQSLVSGYDYADTMASIVNGTAVYTREFPTSRAPVHQLYFDNLVVSDNGVREVARSRCMSSFNDFADYRNFLFTTAARLGENVACNARRHKITPLATISKGYDSPAAAVMAREAGARHAVSIGRARRASSNLFSTDDSGADVAAQLGLACTVHERQSQEYPHEDAVWSVMGNVGDVNLTLFDYPPPLCLLFTGFTGDVLWGKGTTQQRGLQRKDTSGARFSEARLELGVFNCAVPFWGCQNEEQIPALGRLPSMRQWAVRGDYDRPVPRRIVEEAGVHRKSFGIGKRATSFNQQFGRPLSVGLRKDFADFMQQQGSAAASKVREEAARYLRAFELLVVKRLPKMFQVSCGTWIELPGPDMFLLWGMERRINRYLAALGARPPQSP